MALGRLSLTNPLAGKVDIERRDAESINDELQEVEGSIIINYGQFSIH